MRIAPFQLDPTTAFGSLPSWLATNQFKFNITPHLLDVILDRSFTYILEKLTAFLILSLLIIQITAHTSWGWRCSSLKIAFHILIHINLNYYAPEWPPFQSATDPSCLDSLQNRALRLITGQLVSTPLEAFCPQADVQSYNTCSNLQNLILRAWEKTLHSTDYHPKHVALSADVPQRLLNCCSFHHKANDLSTLFPAELEHRQIINHFPSPPWQCSTLRKKHI